MTVANQLRVVFFTAFATPHKGGVERYSLALARRLTQVGHHVTIVTCDTENAARRETIDGIELVRLPAWVLANGEYPIPLPGRRLLRLLRWLRANPPEIVATNTRFYVTSLVGFVIARWVRRPLYHVEHGSCSYQGSRWTVNIFARLVDRTWGSMILRRADRLFAASEGVRTFVRRSGARDAALLLPRVDPAIFHPDGGLRSEWRRKLDIEDDAVVIVFCGRMVRTKGILDLAEAFLGLDADSAMMLFVGDGPDRSRIAESSRVRCLGELDDGGVVGVLNTADIFVNPSYSEGLPYSVLEAGAVGLPVIATDVGGTREIISSPEEGVLVRPGDIPQLQMALQSLVSDGKARSKLGSSLRDRVLSRFSWNDDAVASFIGGN